MIKKINQRWGKKKKEIWKNCKHCSDYIWSDPVCFSKVLHPWGQSGGAWVKAFALPVLA